MHLACFTSSYVCNIGGTHLGWGGSTLCATLCCSGTGLALHFLLLSVYANYYYVPCTPLNSSALLYTSDHCKTDGEDCLH